MNAGITVLLSVIKSQDARYRFWEKAESRMCKSDFDACSSVKQTASLFKELLHPCPKEWFEEDRKVRFEGIMASVPSKAEEYCGLIYGGYMKLPPKKQDCKRSHGVCRFEPSV